MATTGSARLNWIDCSLTLIPCKKAPQVEITLPDRVREERHERTGLPPGL